MAVDDGDVATSEARGHGGDVGGLDRMAMKRCQWGDVYGGLRHCTMDEAILRRARGLSAALACLFTIVHLRFDYLRVHLGR
jgi:hypothetical protein